MSVENYLQNLPEDRLVAFKQLYDCINECIPKGFECELQYKMPTWVIPLSYYPAGYHCDTTKPVPFVSIANQKGFIAIYHMGMYADANLLEWFQKAYAKLNIGKLDMGKSCIRFKKMDKIPFDLIKELMGKMDVESWLSLYKSMIKQ